MEQYDNKPIPHLLELEDEIETNLEKWPLETIQETQRRLHSIICRMNKVRNSRLGIYKLIPDILYEIFTLTVYTSYYPATIALGISHVCHHWRKSALGWPTLWTCVNLEKHPSYVNMLAERSQNAPLTLVWSTGCYGDWRAPSKSYFLSHANSLLSRLCSLTIHTPYSDFAQFLDAIQNSELPALQLRHVDIRLYNHEQNKPIPGLSIHLLYSPCLQEIKLVEFDLPWLDLPHSNLTYFTFMNPINPPALSQLLVFLSNCPVLRVLDLNFRDENDMGVQTAFAMTPTGSTTNKLTLSLTSLRLGALGSSSYDFVQQFSGCIRISGALTRFELSCDREGNSDSDSSPEESGSRLGHWPVPPGTFSHFSNCQYLNIHFEEQGGWLRIYGHTSASAYKSSDSSCPLVIDYTDSWPRDYSPILELFCAMTQLRYLALKHGAWVILFNLWWDLDICSAFPCLDTLELIESGAGGVNSLPESLKIQKLILNSCATSIEALCKVVTRMGIQVLELSGLCTIDGIEDMDIVPSLRERGVDVVWKSETVW